MVNPHLLGGWEEKLNNHVTITRFFTIKFFGLKEKLKAQVREGIQRPTFTVGFP